MRVIAGELGGRRLHAPHGDRTRPTSDRVREALFMALGSLDGVRVVDLYAGSGALAIEALSRGAAWADLVERDVRARGAIARNLDELGLGERVRVWPLKLPGGLARLSSVLARAEVVFVDPPYGGSDARAVLTGLGARDVLKPGTRVVLETHAKDVVPEREGTLARERERRYGETAVHVYRAGGDTPSPKEGEEP
ncbi:MAG TPA: 16S rRNA (guanine(966)-N(2))-methyltransferase RsmD [Candidatus Eisenbacteria bacterium]|jgi:16S rRNA (guanine966-N2)-methyltransferase